ncbi:Streptomyces killer toxin-like beta/gamma crystallin domain-containing protein [Frankia sp. AiPs1]|uniref:hypothetical protein n=1 Tax=Frankia sp. AiPa1 TaxID=573492 RepID=UPI00202AEA7D|nr:hypothetical protein [Frankia sp. AiPa1]MCL9759555.1 hypothetical protein [Frankia sp. AiPa1]
MRKLFSLRRMVILAVLGLVAAVAGPASTASASTPGKLTVCSQGGYDSHVVFPGRGGWSTYLIQPGTCYTSTISGTINEQIDVYQYDGRDHYLGSTIYNGSVGLVVVTTSGPSYYAYVP